MSKEKTGSKGKTDSNDRTPPRDEAEAVLRGKVDLILDSVASLDKGIMIRDAQLKRSVDSLKDIGKGYYDPYMVMVMPGPDEKVKRSKK